MISNIVISKVDCWHSLGINPYEHMVCQTPLFRLWMYVHFLLCVFVIVI